MNKQDAQAANGAQASTAQVLTAAALAQSYGLLIQYLQAGAVQSGQSVVCHVARCAAHPDQHYLLLARQQGVTDIILPLDEPAAAQIRALGAEPGGQLSPALLEWLRLQRWDDVACFSLALTLTWHLLPGRPAGLILPS